MFFDKIAEAKADPVFGLAGAYRDDPRPTKVDLMVGIYKDESLKSELLKSVKKAKKNLLDKDLPADYLPIDGFVDYLNSIAELLFGKKLWVEIAERTYGSQGLGGTGALRLGGEFLFQEVTKRIYIPDPTWANHMQIFERSGLIVETYPYLNKTDNQFDCRAMCQKLMEIPSRSAVLLHATCHNPTGRDPTASQWQEIFSVLKKKDLLPFFDCAYQGFGLGLEKDAESIRECLKWSKEALIAYSCSKNFSLYNERVGALFIVTEEIATKSKVASQVRRLIRSNYSNPPSTGVRIVNEILKDPVLFKLWKEEVEGMRQRISSIRDQFIQRLMERSSRVDFSYLRRNVGLFMLMNFTKPQVEKLIEKFGIYLLDSGRISIAGMNQKNIEYVVDSIIEVSHAF